MNQSQSCQRRAESQPWGRGDTSKDTDMAQDPVGGAGDMGVNPLVLWNSQPWGRGNTSKDTDIAQDPVGGAGDKGVNPLVLGREPVLGQGGHQQ
jgi:hypothetical protein